MFWAESNDGGKIYNGWKENDFEVLKYSNFTKKKKKKSEPLF